jgi:hypothetical protein
MLIPNHPDEERLSALASHDSDATADRSLTDHVASCVRCTDLVDELGALRTSLAQLPDLAPSRPLQLVPGVEPGPSSTDRAGGWARRLFAPILTAGAALAFVGLVGTALPAFSGLAASGAAPLDDAQEAAPSVAQPAAGGNTDTGASPEGARGLTGAEASAPPRESEGPAMASDGASGYSAGGGETSDFAADTERSIWPMVLFAGIALIIGALLMRWILAPRAG